MHIVIVVTHLLGAGHLRRAINLSEACVALGHRATIISGGLPIAQFASASVNLLQLPPIKSDGTNFTTLLKPDNTVADKAYLQQRCDTLCQWVIELNADVVITELFPFGRRMLRTEFLALLDTIRAVDNPPLIMASVRDILAPPSTELKAQKTEAIIHQYYDGVLVHADEAVINLSQSWPLTTSLAAKLYYTGFVAQKFLDTAKLSQITSTNEILVSAGSGSVGRDLYETAIQAAELSSNHWRLLIGGQNAIVETERLQALAKSDNLTIEPARPDFLSLLQQCQCSVSLCGYNTSVDLLQTATPGVLIPFDGGGETEQRLRADSLAQRPNYCVIGASELTVESLLEAVEQLCKKTRDHSQPYECDGANASVRIVRELLDLRLA